MELPAYRPFSVSQFTATGETWSRVPLPALLPSPNPPKKAANSFTERTPHFTFVVSDHHDYLRILRGMHRGTASTPLPAPRTSPRKSKDTLWRHSSALPPPLDHPIVWVVWRIARQMQRWLAGAILHLSGGLTEVLCASAFYDLQCYGVYGCRVVAEVVR